MGIAWKSRLRYLHNTQFDKRRGLFVLVVVVGFSLGGAYDFAVAQIADDPTYWLRLRDVFDLLPWYGWAIAGLSVLALFLFEGGYRASKQSLERIELAQVRESRPSLLIGEPQHRPDSTWFLEVTNKGEAADVRADFRIVDGHRFVPGYRDRYQAHWEGLQSATAHLIGDESRMVGIAKLMVSPMGSGGSFHYILLYWDEVLDSLSSNNTTSWFIPGEGIQKPVITLEARFVCEPKQIEGAIVRSYRLDESGLSEMPTP